MKRTPPFPGLVLTPSVEQVAIPTADGKGVARILEVEVEVWIDPETGDRYLDAEATDALDRAKASHLGILAPDELRRLRARLGLSQRELSELLQIGEKSWTRWETGRARPSRSMNVLLRAVDDGHISVPYLKSLAPGNAGRLCRTMAFAPKARSVQYQRRHAPGPAAPSGKEADEALAFAS